MVQIYFIHIKVHISLVHLVLYWLILLIISTQVPFLPKGNFCCKSSKVIHHRPVLSWGLSTHIDFATRLSNHLHKSANSQTNTATNKKRRHLGLQRKCVFPYLPKEMEWIPVVAIRSPHQAQIGSLSPSIL